MSELLDKSSIKKETSCRRIKKSVSKSLNYIPSIPTKYESKKLLSEPTWGSRTTINEKETMVVNYSFNADDRNDNPQTTHEDTRTLKPIFEANDPDSFLKEEELEKGASKSIFVDQQVPSSSLNTRHEVSEDGFKLQDLIKQPHAVVDEKTRGGIVSKTTTVYKKENEKKSTHVEFGPDSLTDLYDGGYVPSMIDLVEQSEASSCVAASTHVSSFNDYGEPLVGQNIVIDFTPVDGEDERGFLVDKCASFWKFISEHKEIHNLKVLPEPPASVTPTTTVEEDRSVGTSIVSVTPADRTTRGSHHATKPIGLLLSARQRQALKALKSNKSSSVESLGLTPGLKALKGFADAMAAESKLFYENPPMSTLMHCKVESNAYQEYFDEKHWNGRVKKKDSGHQHERKSISTRLSSVSVIRPRTEHRDDLEKIMNEMNNFDKNCPRLMDPPMTSWISKLKLESNVPDKPIRKAAKPKVFKCDECSDQLVKFQFSPLEDEPRPIASSSS